MTHPAGSGTLSTAQRIKMARIEAGWTQKQLADACGLHQPNIARYEKGSSAPTGETVDRIMAVLRNAGATVVLDSVDNVLGIQGRSGGKLGVVANLMEVPAPKEWIVDGVLARGFVTLVAGQEGSGKSMLTQTLAVRLACGDREAFGFRLGARIGGYRVLMVDVENVMMLSETEVDASVVTERLQAYGLTRTAADNITVVGALGFDLDRDSDILDGILTDAARDGQPYDVVILDSFRSLWTNGSENTPEAGRVLQKINRLAFTHHAGVIVIHHTNKAGAAYSGHTSIGSTVAAVWTFSRLVHKSPDTGKKEQHATMRYLAPYKVRIAAEAKSRIVNTSATGITSPKRASDYEGYDVDLGTDEGE